MLRTCAMKHAASHSLCTAMVNPAGSDEINDLAQLLDCVADILWCT
jgi:hypothetical protein